MLFGLVNACLYSALLPLWEGFDEAFHYGYVETLWQTHRLPVLGRTLLPADVEPPSGANYLRGRIEIASFLGTAIQYVVHTAGGEEFTAIEQNRTGRGPQSLGPGREVLLAWDPVHSFLVAKKEAVDARP